MNSVPGCDVSIWLSVHMPGCELHDLFVSVCLMVGGLWSVCGCMNHNERSLNVWGCMSQNLWSCSCLWGYVSECEVSTHSLCVRVLGCEVSELIWGAHSSMWGLWSVSGVFLPWKISDLIVIVGCRTWGLWSICGSQVSMTSTLWNISQDVNFLICLLYMTQGLRFLIYLWVCVAEFEVCGLFVTSRAGCEVSNLCVDAYPRISAPWSVWWCISHGVSLWTICLRSLICLWLHVRVVRSVIPLLVCVPGCECPDLFVGSIWWCEMSDVFTGQWTRVWSLQPVGGCSPRTWVL